MRWLAAERPTDWTLIVADARDEGTSSMKDVGDVDAAKVSKMREWSRNAIHCLGPLLQYSVADRPRLPSV